MGECWGSFWKLLDVSRVVWMGSSSKCKAFKLEPSVPAGYFCAGNHRRQSAAWLTLVMSALEKDQLLCRSLSVCLSVCLIDRAQQWSQVIENWRQLYWLRAQFNTQSTHAVRSQARNQGFEPMEAFLKCGVKRVGVPPNVCIDKSQPHLPFDFFGWRRI